MITDALEKGFLFGWSILGAGVVAIGIPLLLLVVIGMLCNLKKD